MTHRLEFSANEINEQQLFAHLNDGTRINVDGYSLSIEKDIFGDFDVWITDPYGSDLGFRRYTVEACGDLLARIRAADPNGTERGPW